MVLLPSESFSNAITCDFKVPVSPQCAISVLFSALMFNIASEIAPLGGFPP